jgi:hypothetical protein
MDITEKPAELVAKYIALRDQKEAATAKFKEFMTAHYEGPMELLEAQLLDTLNKLGVESIASSNGTVYKSLSTSVTVADAREFRRHVIGGEEWELIDWRANKTAINNIIDEGGVLPPGINRSAFYKVNIRRKSGK